MSAKFPRQVTRTRDAAAILIRDRIPLRYPPLLPPSRAHMPRMGGGAGRQSRTGGNRAALGPYPVCRAQLRWSFPGGGRALVFLKKKKTVSGTCHSSAGGETERF